MLITTAVYMITFISIQRNCNFCCLAFSHSTSLYGTHFTNKIDGGVHHVVQRRWQTQRSLSASYSTAEHNNCQSNCGPNNVVGVDYEDKLQSDPETWQFNRKLLRKSRRRGPKSAEDMLIEAIRDQDGGIQPDVYSYTICMQAWCKAKEPQKAQNILELLCSQSVSDPGNERIKPNIISYHTVIRGWCSIGMVQKGEEIVRILERTEGSPRPDVAVYNCILHGYTQQLVHRRGERLVKRDDKESRKLVAKKSLKLLNNLEAAYDKDHSLLLKPDIITYNSVLHALARDGNHRQAEGILRKMERGLTHAEPDIISYSSVVDAYIKGKAKNAAKKADMLLERAEKTYHKKLAEVGPDQSQHETLSLFKPNVELYSTVINAYAYSHDKKVAIPRVIGILRKMERLYAEGDESMRPNVVTYNAVINAHAKSSDPEVPFQVESIVNQMWENGVMPDTLTYNSLMKVWSNSNCTQTDDKNGNPEPIKRMLGLLDEMMSRGVRPNTNTFNSIIHGLGKFNQPLLAEEIIEQMKEYGVDPDVWSYNSAIAAWARSNSSEGGEMAERLLDKMERGVDVPMPDSVTYCSVINAWAKRRDPQRAELVLKRMESRYNSKINGPKPTVLAYKTVIRSYADCYSQGNNEEVLIHTEALIKKLNECR